MPKGGDLNLYRASRDLQSFGDARRTFYDLSRDSGMTHDQASHYADLGAARFGEGEGESKLPAVRSTSTAEPGDRPAPVARARARSPFKTPYFGPHAGKLCHVDPVDGTLTPVDEG